MYIDTYMHSQMRSYTYYSGKYVHMYTKVELRVIGEANLFSIIS